jgi:hypothetical protein
MVSDDASIFALARGGGGTEGQSPRSSRLSKEFDRKVRITYLLVKWQDYN